MNLVLAHEILNVFWMIWDTLLAEEAAAVACDENVVLDTDSTEILVCLQLLIVDEVLVETLSCWFVDFTGLTTTVLSTIEKVSPEFFKQYSKTAFTSVFVKSGFNPVILPTFASLYKKVNSVCF